MPEIRKGPLSGVRILEFAAKGPVAFCGMLLSDLGADVVRIDRAGEAYDRFTIEARGRRSVCLDLKSPKDRPLALDLIAKADALIEGFRPGVMERLGLGPDVALARNPALVFGRMTGWGQQGPCAAMAGHDINFIAITGALHSIGLADRPIPPLNLVGDFGGGALYLALGILAALRHADKTGQGQVIDSAMTDGTISLMSMVYGHLARGTWGEQRESNFVDGGAHFYGCYQCADGAWIAIGAIEPNFYSILRNIVGLEEAAFDAQMDQQAWPRLKEKLAAAIAKRTRAEWVRLLEGTDACFAPVLSPREAFDHPHNGFRRAFVEIDGVRHPAPAPRFSLTPGEIQSPPTLAGCGGEDALRDWGVVHQVGAASA